MPTVSRMVLYAVGALTLAAAPVRALPITDLDSGLTLAVATGDDIIGQTNVNPCVIGPPNCNNDPGFLYTLSGSGGGGSTYDKTSPLYTAAQISGVIGGSNAFTMMLDYNQTSVAQTLNVFEAIYFDGGTELSRQTFDIPTVLQTINNGAGFSDFLITGFVLPAAATNVQFHANWFNNDGADRYFIRGAESVPCIPGVDCPTVPEPGLMTLFGLGMLGAGVIRRRRKS